MGIQNTYNTTCRVNHCFARNSRLVSEATPRILFIATESLRRGGRLACARRTGTSSSIQKTILKTKKKNNREHATDGLGRGPRCCADTPLERWRTLRNVAHVRTSTRASDSGWKTENEWVPNQCEAGTARDRCCVQLTCAHSWVHRTGRSVLCFNPGVQRLVGACIAAGETRGDTKRCDRGA